MAELATQSESTIVIKRTFSASPERVFEAMTDPARMAKWFGRGTETCKLTRIVEADVRPGGRWSAVMHSPDGKECHMKGQYKEVRPPELLSFTWGAEQMGFEDSLVKIEIRRLGQSNFSEVILQHSLLPEPVREGHRKGWNACFDMLEKVVAAGT